MLLERSRGYEHDRIPVDRLDLFPSHIREDHEISLQFAVGSLQTILTTEN